MGCAVISYRAINDSSNEARSVARRLSDYANGLERNVYKKLQNYGGNHTGNISSAMSHTNSKIRALREKAGAYERYAGDLKNLQDICKSTDKAVRTSISSLSATFRRNNGIEVNPFLDAIHGFFTNFKNSTFIGRFISGLFDMRDMFKEYIGNQIATWWNYQGGKEFIKGFLVGFLEVVAGVCAIAGAILSGGALIVVVAGVIAGVIAVVNGVVNMVNERRALHETWDCGNPALGRRLSDENTLQDTLRKETDSSFWHNVANTVDVVNTVCTVISVVDSIGSLIKKAYKWSTGTMTSLKDLKVKNILSNGNFKTNFKAFVNKLSETKVALKDGFKNIITAAKFGHFEDLTEFASDFKFDFLNSLKNGYLKFGNKKEIFKSIGNMAQIPKVVLEKGLTMKTIMKDLLLDKVIIPHMPFGEYSTSSYDPKSLDKNYEFYKFTNKGINGYTFDNFHLEDFKKPFDKMSKAGKTVIEIKKDIELQQMSINIPVIKMPSVLPKLYFPKMPTGCNPLPSRAINFNFNFNISVAGL